MRIVLLTAAVMVAFAANSLLNRAAVGDGAIGPLSFAAIRLGAGALVLWGIVAARRRAAMPGRGEMAVGALSLLAYMLGFSVAYLELDAGLGALILFGGVQVTMFAGAVLSGERPPAARWIGVGLALGGLAWLLWPRGTVSVEPAYAAAMGVAAVGWGVYSLNGRRACDPLAATAANFALATPFALLALVWAAGEPVTGRGVALAVVSGAVTSGMGYALWYAVLPRIDTGVAALAQLTVPVIAILAAIPLLGESLTVTVALGALMVIGGVAYGIRAPGPQRTSNSSGS